MAGRRPAGIEREGGASAAARPDRCAGRREPGRRVLREVLAGRPRGLAARAYLRIEPAGQRLAVLDRRSETLFGLDRVQPGTGLPVPACHEPLASQQITAWMIGRVTGRDPFEARLGPLVAVRDKGGDDPIEFLAFLSGNRIAVAGELIGRHLMRTHGHVQAVVRDLEIDAAGPGAGQVRAQMFLVRALVWRKAQVAVEAEDLGLDIRLPQVLLQLAEQGLHRLSHLLLVDLSVGLEVGLAVVALQAVKEL